MAKLFDTHSHYTDEKLFGNEELLAEIFAGDVGNIVTVAVDTEDSAKCVSLANAHENMFCSVGIHPSEIDKVSDIPAEVAKLAHKEGLTLKAAALKLGYLDEKTLNEALRPEKMI